MDTDVSILGYGDDLLKLNWSVASLENSYPVMDDNYKRIGSSLNALKLQVLLFNCRLNIAFDVMNLGGRAIKKYQGTYLSRSSNKLIIGRTEKKLRGAYTSLICLTSS